METATWIFSSVMVFFCTSGTWENVHFHYWYATLWVVIIIYKEHWNTNWNGDAWEMKRWQGTSRRQRCLHNHKLDQKRKSHREPFYWAPQIQICLIPVTDTSSSVWEAKNIFSSEITIFFVCTAGTGKRAFHVGVYFSIATQQIKYKGHTLHCI